MVPLFLALLAAFLFGVSTPLSKAFLSQWTPLQLAGLLYLGAALGAASLLLSGRKPFLAAALDRATLRRLSGAILFGGILGPIFLLCGLKLASASSVSLWLNLEMVATALIGVLFFRDHLGRYGWLGAACILGAGAALSFGEGVAGGRAGGFLALACACWGMDNNLSSLIDGLLPLQSTFWKGLAAGTFNLALGFLWHRSPGSPAGAGLALATGALCYGASIALYLASSQSLGAARGQMIFAAGPLFGLALSHFWLREPWGPQHAWAVGLQTAGLFLLFRDRHSHRHAHDAMEHTHGHSHDDGHHGHVHEGMPASLRHAHPHRHDPMTHAHPHWPDLHHRHAHPH